MRELRDRAAILYITVGPSALHIPVNVEDEEARMVRVLAAPKVETDAMRKYRQAFHPRPAPTSRIGKALLKLGQTLSSTL